MMKMAVLSLSLTMLVIIYSFRPPDREKIKQELGQQLFFDPILSKDYKQSCSSCHNPRYAFADSVAFSLGNDGHPGKRNAPSVMNMSDRSAFFYDGRAASLEEQALFPIADPLEMNLPVNEALKRIREHDGYFKKFRKAFGKEPDARTLGEALAAFERTLESSNSEWDRYVRKLDNTLSQEALLGRSIFNGKGKCFDCHLGPDFTNDEFKNIGLFNGKDLNDSGRFIISKRPEDIGSFKVPGLRNVAVTAPYMHDGRFKTLEDVVAYYNDPKSQIPDAIGTDTLLAKPLNLSALESSALIAFLKSLTDRRFTKVDP